MISDDDSELAWVGVEGLKASNLREQRGRPGPTTNQPPFFIPIFFCAFFWFVTDSLDRFCFVAARRVLVGVHNG